MSVEKLRASERNGWFIAIGATCFLIGMIMQQILTPLTMSPWINKIPDYNGDVNGTTTIPITTTTPFLPSHGQVTHFIFYDTGDNNGGRGFTGLYNPSGNIWYLRWHTVAIKEMGVREGKLLVNSSYSDLSGNFFSVEILLEFTRDEVKTDLSFLISVTEVTKEEINYATCKIELVGET